MRDSNMTFGLVHRARSSPAFWVLLAALVPALVCTPIAWFLFPQAWQLVALFWYTIPASSFVYLPHEPAVVYAGAVYAPWKVALVGGLATVVAAIVDYYVVRRVFEFRRVAPVKRTAIYHRAVRYFYWKPWATIAVISFSFIPFYPLRILAPSSGYPISRYVTAYLAGRVPRYYLLAMGGAWMPVPSGFLLLMAFCLAAFPLTVVYWFRRTSRAQSGSIRIAEGAR